MDRTKLIVLLVLVGFILSMPGCIGPFNLTRQVHHWNSNLGSEWVNELVFLVCVIVPVYGVTLFVDGILFNSIEFWGGDNPVDPPGATTGYVLPDTDGGVVLVDSATGQTARLTATEVEQLRSR